MIRSLPVATVSCPSCHAEFPVDPGKVPAEGVHAICSSCQRVFRVERSGLGEGDPARSEVASPPASPETVESAPGSDAPPDGALDEPAVQAPGPAKPGPAGLPASQPPFQDEVAEEEPLVEDAPSPSPELEESVEPEPIEERPFEDLRSLASEAMAEPDEAEDQDSIGATEGTLSSGRERFGQRDPHERARRLARVLVSDIIAYHPARYHDSYARGTLKEDFEDEVKKSWKEYVDQVGEELAESTPYFDEALNEILGKGESVF